MGASLAKSLAKEGIFGAPEGFRTPNPQIPSLGGSFSQRISVYFNYSRDWLQCSNTRAALLNASQSEARSSGSLTC